MSIEFVNEELKKGHLRAETYSLIRSIDSSLEYGTKTIPLFITMPRLKDIIGDAFPARVLFHGYTIAEKQIKPMKEGKCCIVSFILSPDVKRLDRGQDVVIQREVEATIVSRNVGSGGLQIYAAIMKPMGTSEQKDIAETERLQSEVTTSELAVKLINQLKKEVSFIDRDAIEELVLGYSSRYQLTNSQIASIINKMLRMRYGVECLSYDREVDRVAREELQSLLWEGLGTLREEDVKSIRNRKWSPEFTKMVRNRVLSLYYNIDCERERYEAAERHEAPESEAVEENDTELLLAEELLRKAEEDIVNVDETDIESIAKQYKVSPRVRELMLRLKYGVICYPESDEVNRIATQTYQDIKMELFGAEPTASDLRYYSSWIERRLRERVLNKMLAIRYKIQC